jgi:hypothetical protein
MKLHKGGKTMSKLAPVLILMVLSGVGTAGEEEAIKRLKDGGARVTEIKGGPRGDYSR